MEIGTEPPAQIPIHKGAKRYFISILIGLVLFSVVFGGVYLYLTHVLWVYKPVLTSNVKTSSSSPYTGWYKFYDNYNQVSFLYPSDWKVVDSNVEYPGLNLPDCHESRMTLTGPNGYVLNFTYNINNCNQAGEPFGYFKTVPIQIGGKTYYKAYVSECNTPGLDQSTCKDNFSDVIIQNKIPTFDQAGLPLKPGSMYGGSPYFSFNNTTSSIILNAGSSQKPYISLSDKNFAKFDATFDLILKSISFDQSSMTPAHGEQIVNVDNSRNKFIDYDTGIEITYPKQIYDPQACVGNTNKYTTITENEDLEVMKIDSIGYFSTGVYAILPQAYPEVSSVDNQAACLYSDNFTQDNVSEWATSRTFPNIPYILVYFTSVKSDNDIVVMARDIAINSNIKSKQSIPNNALEYEYTFYGQTSTGPESLGLGAIYSKKSHYAYLTGTPAQYWQIQNNLGEKTSPPVPEVSFIQE